jgi:hypothetical protein
MATALATAPRMDVSKQRASSALLYAGIGFVVGSMVVWGGCRPAGRVPPLAVCAFGGVLFAILGAILGSVMGGVKK